MADLKSHHSKAKCCASRPKYREAKWERAVKVYTINLESKYLLVQGVPALGVTKDLLEMFAIYGAINEYRILDDYPAEEFTSVYWVKFQHIMAARKAKRKLDNRSFFGGVLHVSYAPEFESVDETREKLMDRKRIVARKVKGMERRTEEERVEQPNTQTKQDSREPKTQTLQSNYRQQPQPTHSTDHTLSSELPLFETRTAVTDAQRETLIKDVYNQSGSMTGPSYPSQISTASITWNPVPTMPSSLQEPGALVHGVRPHHHLGSSRTVNTTWKINGKETFIGPVRERPEVSRHSSSTETLTGNPSMDRTVFSIREKLNRINSSSEIGRIGTERNQKRPMDSETATNDTKRKERKRI